MHANGASRSGCRNYLLGNLKLKTKVDDEVDNIEFDEDLNYIDLKFTTLNEVFEKLKKDTMEMFKHITTIAVEAAVSALMLKMKEVYVPTIIESVDENIDSLRNNVESVDEDIKCLRKQKKEDDGQVRPRGGRFESFAR